MDHGLNGSPPNSNTDPLTPMKCVIIYWIFYASVHVAHRYRKQCAWVYGF
jgi:hypothetical protein